MILSESEVLAQSRSAMGQWEDLWRSNCTRNAEVYRKSGTSLRELLFMGRGKVSVVIGMGSSFMDDIKLLKKYRDTNKFDIIAVDKAAIYLQNEGIYADYVVLADAQISYKWVEGFYSEYHGKDLEPLDTSKSTLITNVNASPEWVTTWKGPIYFYVNKDNIQSEKIFSKISGCQEMIPAASCVGNAAVVLANNVMDYDLIMLSGHNFCYDKHYYAFSPDSDKRFYMGHRISIDQSGRIVRTSENLLFSSKWLGDFIRVSKPNICNTTKETILEAPFVDLEKQLAAAYERQLEPHEIEDIIDRSKLIAYARNEQELQSVCQGKMINRFGVEIIPEHIIDKLNLRSENAKT